MEIYIVQPGDTIRSIAARFNITPNEIIADNGLRLTNYLMPGQSLIILRPIKTYTVKPGDTLYSIAKRNNTTIVSLLQNNPDLIQKPYVYAGQQITLEHESNKLGKIAINGYVYPYVQTQDLINTLAYLTTLTIFGYGFTEEGELIEINDEPLIRMAKYFDVAPIMLFSSITENGTTSGELASYLFNNIEFQNMLIDKLIRKMKQKGYYGIDIDFEFINPEDRDAYTAFIQNITQKMNSQGFTVNVDLAPKTSPEQKGLLYEAHNYAALGEAANTVLLMTYEWGYTYGPPMAVAPINEVRRVVEYGVSQIPPQKIYMGIPNYGYDFTLPFQKGVSRAPSIGNEQAIQIASIHGSPIQYDELAQSPYFNYIDSQGREHEVWFEDARSIKAKLELLHEYNLYGAGYWNVMRPFAQNWTLVNALFDIIKIVKK